MFELDSRLASDTYVLGDLELCRVLLSRDANYPWCILVPRRENILDWYQLEEKDQLQLMRESCRLSKAMVELFNPFKMNVAALGNQVPQLHIHHIARFVGDVAWPQPVWGKVPASVYEEEVSGLLIKQLQTKLALA